MSPLSDMMADIDKPQRHCCNKHFFSQEDNGMRLFFDNNGGKFDTVMLTCSVFSFIYSAFYPADRAVETLTRCGMWRVVSLNFFHAISKICVCTEQKIPASSLRGVCLITHPSKPQCCTMVQSRASHLSNALIKGKMQSI